MTRHAPRRQPAQIMALAAVSLVALVSMIAFAIDASTFFVIKRELQNTADAAALAAVRYLGDTDPLAQPPQIDPSCIGTLPQQVACMYVEANKGTAQRLCGSAVTSDPIVVGSRSLTGFGSSPTLQVTVRCNAQFWFGKIINLHARPISATATAAVGLWDTGPPPHQIVDYLDGFPSRVTTRLIPY